MRLRNVVFMTVVLVFILTSPAVSQQWVDVKDPKDLKALHSNKTFKFTYMQVPVVEHYRADGKGIRISAQLRDPFTWEVKGDQVCVVPYHDLTPCWQYQHSKKNPEEYVRREPKHGIMQVIKVEDGIPEF
jgi:hypothetical protein